MFPILMLLAVAPSESPETPRSIQLPSPMHAAPMHEPAAAPATKPTECSGWPGFCPPLDPSAPFLRTPSIEALGPCKGSGRRDEKCDANAWSHTFTSAAHFPIPRFTAAGEPVSADGLVIYEGMKFTAYPETGHYDLSFTATAPNVPVTVRLQLELSSDRLEPIRLTLPPIVIVPSPAARLGDPAGTTLAINHRGFSAALIKSRKTTLVFPNAASVTPDPHNPIFDAYVASHWIVRRFGTARFGSNAPTADEYGR